MTDRSQGIGGALRGGVVALLAVATVLAWRSGEPAPGEGRVPGGGEGATPAAQPAGPARGAGVTGIVLEAHPGGGWSDPGPGARLAVRGSPGPPGPVELEALERVAREVPLLGALPEGVTVEAEAPRAPRAGRVAALPFVLRGAAGDTLRVRLLDAAGAVDSLEVSLDAGGRGRGAFRLRPSRPGWQEWRLTAVEVGAVEAGVRRRGERGTEEAAGGSEVAVGALVREAAPLRVLVVSGPPTWESRFLLRALDEAGVEGRAVLPLGQGFHAGDLEGLPVAGGGVPGVDAVVVLPGAELDAVGLRALREFVEGGGGVAAVGRPDLWRALGVERSPAPAAAGSVRGDSLAWNLPTELVPLPPAEVRGATLPLGDPGTAARGILSESRAGGSGEDPAPVLAAVRPLGRGRVLALGLVESWRWRMEGGRLEAHREFWRSALEWLAGDGDDAPPVRFASGKGAVGIPRVVERFATGIAGEDARPFRVVRPDGSTEWLAPRRMEGAGGVLRAVFLPDTAGLYRVEGWEGAEPAGFQAEADPGPAPGAVAQLAFLAHRSGGGLHPADSLDRVVEARLAEMGDPGRGGGGWVLLLAVAALALALVEWTLRRLSGRP